MMYVCCKAGECTCASDIDDLVHAADRILLDTRTTTGVYAYVRRPFQKG